MMTLAQAHALLPASTLIGDGSVSVQRVHSDTRSLQPGDLFVALKGEHFDAHEFLPQARAAGAVAALAEHGLSASQPGLLVTDARSALGELATAWRHRFHLPLIAVTGSNGKTTVTQMIASMLRAWLGTSAFATEGNFNNDIGVPLTLLRLRQDDTTFHRAGVVELGMNHPGEIASLARMAAPTVALVNNAQREHLEFMAASTRWRARTAPSSRRWARRAWRCVRPTTPSRHCGAHWPGRVRSRPSRWAARPT